MKKSGCTCIDFRAVANRLTQLYDGAMAASGMTVTQFSQLHTIQQLGTPTLNQLADATGLERSTLGRNVRVLEKLGFVSLAVGKDARTREIHITRSGKAAFKRAVPLWQEVQTGLASSLGAEGYAKLNDLLTNTNDACAALSAR